MNQAPPFQARENEHNRTVYVWFIDGEANAYHQHTHIHFVYTQNPLHAINCLIHANQNGDSQNSVIVLSTFVAVCAIGHNTNKFSDISLVIC